MSKAEKYNSPHDIAFRAREADGEKMKDVDKIASEIQSHTNATLQELKERVEGMEQQERIYADMCYNEALWRVIETIEDMKNE